MVYLFETIEQWSSAVIFSRDADYVPAVWALRRKGKRVYCAAPETESGSPLVQACQTFLPWDVGFLRADRALFEALQPGSSIDKFVRANNVESIVREGGLHLRGAITGGNHLNGLNELLRDTGLYAVDSGKGLIIQACDPARPGALAAITASNDVFAGFTRHGHTATSTLSAAWRPLLTK